MLLLTLGDIATILARVSLFRAGYRLVLSFQVAVVAAKVTLILIDGVIQTLVL